jgi:hypothetical protein
MGRRRRAWGALRTVAELEAAREFLRDGVAGIERSIAQGQRVIDDGRRLRRLDVELEETRAFLREIDKRLADAHRAHGVR